MDDLVSTLHDEMMGITPVPMDELLIRLQNSVDRFNQRYIPPPDVYNPDDWPKSPTIHSPEIAQRLREDWIQEQTRRYNDAIYGRPQAKCVHCMSQEFLMLDESQKVYIGREIKPNHRDIGYGNPYRIKAPGIPDALTAIDMYKRYLVRNTELLVRARRELRGKVLGCWCKSKTPLLPGMTDAPCHGDILVIVANMSDRDFDNLVWS